MPSVIRIVTWIEDPAGLAFDFLAPTHQPVMTALSFGVSTQPRVSSVAGLESPVDFDPYGATVDQLIEAWLPLTFAINALNRSMGLNDLYPFVIAPAIACSSSDMSIV